MKNFKLNHLLYIIIFGLTASCNRVETNIAFSGGQYVTTWEIADFTAVNDSWGSTNYWKWLDDQGYSPTDYIKYDVDVFYFEFQTTDPNGESVKASANICVPKDATGSLPLALYHHATVYNPLYQNTYIPSTWASRGIIVISTHYLGENKSACKAVHPYFMVDAYGQLATDLLAASKSILDQNSIAYTQDLLLMGHSEGGNAALAVAKKFQEDEIPVTLVTSSAAAAHLEHWLLGAWQNPNPVSATWEGALVVAKLFFAASSYAANTCYPNTGNLYENESFKTKVTTNFKLFFKEPFATEFINAYLDKENRYLKLLAIEEIYNALPDGKRPPIAEVLLPNIAEQLDTNPYYHPFIQFYVAQNIGLWRPEMPLLIACGSADLNVPYLLSLYAYQVFTQAYQAPSVSLALYPGYDHSHSRYPMRKNTMDMFFDLINTGT